MTTRQDAESDGLLEFGVHGIYSDQDGGRSILAYYGTQAMS